MALCGSCDARDGERIRSRELSLTGVARVCGEVGSVAGVSREAGVVEEAPVPMHRTGAIDSAMHSELNILAATWDRGTKQLV